MIAQDDDLRVSLTPVELRIAAAVGVERQIQNLLKGLKDAHGADPEKGWQIHVEGAAGEMAFAKWRNRYWSGNLGNLKADDVGHVQVRTRSRHDYDLIVHRTDPDDRPFVLLTGLAPRFVLRGWIMGAAAKQERWWRDPAKGRPAFFVPQSELRPMPGMTPQVRRSA